MSDSDDLFGSDDGIEELLDLPDGSAAKFASPPKPAPPRRRLQYVLP